MTRFCVALSLAFLVGAALLPPPPPAWTAEPPTPVIVAPETSPRPVPRPLCPRATWAEPCITPSSWSPR